MSRDTGRDAAAGRDRRRFGWTVRQRLLAMMIGLMALGLALTGVLSTVVQFASLDERVDNELRQEVEELQVLAQSGQARDGVPYDDVSVLFRSFLETAVAGDDEAFMALVDGQAVLRSGGDRPFDIDDPEVRAKVEEMEVEEGRARIESLRTQDTELRVMVADVALPEEVRTGTFVVVNDIGRQEGRIWRRTGTYAATALASLVVAGVLAHVVLGRLLRPLRELREATAEISTDDLSRRVDVAAAGDTDVAELALTFNEMLDRIDDGLRRQQLLLDDQRQFLDDAAHELRTPLTILRGNAELLRAEDPEEVVATRVMLLDEVDRMQRLVDDLLMLARSQRHDFVRPQPTDLTELAVECMERVTALGQRQWQLAADAEGTLPVDRHRLIQAVVQLVANAVKFSPEGSVIELATGWVDRASEEGVRARDAGAAEAGHYLALSVSDHGAGIPEMAQARIFDRFGRADNAAHVDGSGLGLAIVQAIAVAHGGAVGVRSVEGLGSRFTIWLPDGSTGGDEPAGR
ncbi:sensor histidine kinase [Ornithinimicrobium sp. LYQ92]|uniref:sensor histidine kinase n=1 Tax=Serinicoccus sp. LYQ92 TaxID=3378798 RepID=UPI003854E2D6